MLYSPGFFSVSTSSAAVIVSCFFTKPCQHFAAIKSQLKEALFKQIYSPDYNNKLAGYVYIPGISETNRKLYQFLNNGSCTSQDHATLEKGPVFTIVGAVLTLVVLVLSFIILKYGESQTPSVDVENVELNQRKTLITTDNHENMQIFYQQ